MNINLIYEGKDYNFDIPNSVTIDYIKELSSKIFNSDKALLDLLYNNKKFENKDDNTLLRDLITEGETNTVLTVQINKDSNNNKNEVTPLVILKNKETNISDKEIKIFKEKEDKKEYIKYENNKNIEKKKIHMIKSNPRSKLFSNDNKKNNLNKKVYDFKIFQSNFIQKNKELLEIMKEFNNKIKEIYLFLFKKYKNAGSNQIKDNSCSSNNSSISSISIGINNNYYYELSIYENKLSNFQEKQIQFYKTLLDLLKKYEKNKDFLKLYNFYTYLSVNSCNSSNINKEDFFKKNKSLKFQKLSNNKVSVDDNNKLRKNNLSSLNINNDNYLPLLKVKNINSSLNLGKKNINFNLSNNISSINSYKSITKKNNLNNKILINKEKDLNLNVNNNNIKTIKNTTIQNQLSNNNIIKNNNVNYKENTNEKEKDKHSEKSSTNSDNLSEKDLVENLTINENKTKIAPIPLRIRNSISNNIIPRKFSVINNNSLRSNSIIKNINNDGIENFEKFNEEKKTQKTIRFSSANINYMNNKLKNSPILNKKNEISPYNNKKKENNESSNELINIRKIKNIDISSMTVNDSNFIRDKLKNNKKKNNKDMNKYDFFM